MPCQSYSRYSLCQRRNLPQERRGCDRLEPGRSASPAWEPGRRLTLAAFDDYWGGRPYLDAVAIEFGTRTRARRPVRYPGWSRAADTSGRPGDMVVGAANSGGDYSEPMRDPVLLQALALSIDRAPIVNVLAQHKGEAAFGLLPQWLSGYAFLFQSTPDVMRAQAARSLSCVSEPMSLSYPANDLFLRSVAERVALNARDAGIAIQPTPGGNGNLRLIGMAARIHGRRRRAQAHRGTIGRRRTRQSAGSRQAGNLYQFERSLLDEHRIIPLVYLRETYGIAPRVHFQPSNSDPFTLHLEDAWLQP